MGRRRPIIVKKCYQIAAIRIGTAAGLPPAVHVPAVAIWQRFLAVKGYFLPRQRALGSLGTGRGGGKKLLINGT